MSAVNIFTAAANGDIAAIQAALNEGINIDDKNRDYYAPDESRDVTALYIAVFNRQFAAAEFLIMNGADVNISQTTSQITPLMVAVSNSNLPLVELLLRQKADVTAMSLWGLQAIHHLNSMNSAILKLLIEHGAKVDVPYSFGSDTFGKTPLYVAAHNDDVDSVKILLAANADPTPARGATANEEINKLLEDKIKQSEAKRPRPS